MYLQGPVLLKREDLDNRTGNYFNVHSLNIPFGKITGSRACAWGWSTCMSVTGGGFSPSVSKGDVGYSFIVQPPMPTATIQVDGIIENLVIITIIASVAYFLAKKFIK